MKEEYLFIELVGAHLSMGGGIGFRDRKWTRELDKENSYICLGDDSRGVILGTWNEPANVARAVVIEVGRERRSLNDVFFFFTNDKGTAEGVTWRMLKIDMSFLRVVLDREEFSMREIIRRFVRISENTQNESFKNLN